jgi:RNA polymerase sigma factor (TIGR02999 family)
MIPPDGSPAADAAEGLFATLYAELHRLAEHHLRQGGSGLSLGTTTLLHEAYLNISGREGVAFRERGSFLAYASRAMRGLVIDYVRSRQAIKRGARFEITRTGDAVLEGSRNADAEQLDGLSDALDRLAALNPSLSELVDLHFFCGFTFLEIAEFRGVSDRTVKRDWRKARLMLYDELKQAGQAEPE